MRAPDRAWLCADPGSGNEQRGGGGIAVLTIRRVAETGSTNADMLRAATTGATEGDWIVADRQNNGRGRLGRRWESQIGNVHASGLVRLRSGDPDAATLALVAAIALHETVGVWAGAERLTVKWPNDLLAGDAKLAGVLLERTGDAVIVGIGVNLVTAPEGLARPVTSLVALDVAPPEPFAFLETLATRLEHWLTHWRGEGIAAIRAAWLSRAHRVGTALAAALPDGERVEGLFDGLTDACALRLRLADGQVRVIHAADVFLI